VGNNNATAIGSFTTNYVAPVITYSWVNSSGVIVSQTNNSTLLTNTATALSNGNYTLFAQINAPCGPVVSNTVNINCVCGVTAVATTSCVSSGGLSTTFSLVATSGVTTTPVTYLWNGPASFLSSNTNTTVTNLVSGIYTLNLSAPGCITSNTVSVIVPSSFTPVITTTNVTCYNGNNGLANVSSITGTSTAPYTYNWSTAPAQTNSLASGLTIGNYTCFVTDALGCSYSASASITQPSAVTVAIAAGTLQVCVGNSISLTASASGGIGGIYTYNWSNGPTTNNYNFTSPSISGGAYTYTVTAFDVNTCTATAVKTVTFIPNPVLVVNSKEMCYGQTVNLTVNGASNYVWSPSTALSNTVGSSVSSNPAVTTIYNIVGNNAFCIGTTNVTVTVVQYPDLTISCANQIMCRNESTTIQASGAQNYIWTPNNAIASIGANSSVVNPIVNTTFTIVGYNSLNSTTCSVQKLMPIVVVPQVIPTVSENKVICLGQKAVFTANGGDKFEWLPKTNISSNTAQTIVSTATASTIYTVLVSNNGFCGHTTTVSLIVNPNPQLNAGRDSTYNVDEQIFLNATGTGTISWTSGEAIECKVCPNTQITPRNTNCYIAESINEFGCKVTDEVCIDIRLDNGLFVPNTFTPNEDGLNDVFLASGYSISDFKMSIFDRWGENLFNSNDIAKGWNGTYKGKLCEAVTYVYKIFYKGVDNKKYEKIGHVTLIR
jgi:trimeric autotransporter adhesin